MSRTALGVNFDPIMFLKSDTVVGLVFGSKKSILNAVVHTVTNLS